MIQQPRCAKRRVNGVLLLDKPYQLSSHSALQTVRRLFNAAKGGHAGILDPLATGLLPICLGEATKFCAFLLEADKCYTATILLGKVTTTGDAEGKVVLERPVDVSERDLHTILARFIGDILQVPPMYSALKVHGIALYRYARQGISIERQPRKITVHSLKLLSFNGEEAILDVKCSKGTYIRTLAQDIGEALGCGAYMSALRRTATARFNIDAAVTLDTLNAWSEAERDSCLLAVDQLVAHLPAVYLPVDIGVRFCCGQAVRISKNHAIMPFSRVYCESTRRFLGLAKQQDESLLQPVRLMAAPAVA